MLSAQWLLRLRMLRHRPLHSSLRLTASSSSMTSNTKAVIFDMGGVLIPSPLPLLADYERKTGLPLGTFRQAVLGQANTAWEQLERGEISADEFSRKFSDECSEVVGWTVDLSQFVGNFEQMLGTLTLRSEMIGAIRCLRTEGIKTALLTNNFNMPNGRLLSLLDTSLFDMIIESWRVKMRKPERRIYDYTLSALSVKPSETVFLDDLGVNLKIAKELGMRTIKVSEPAEAVDELEKEVGFCLRGYVPGTTVVPKRLQIPVDNLADYLRETLGLNDKAEPVVRCFEHGQSNPTYSVVYPECTLVLRKKPPGKLLSSAHAVEREYTVMKAVIEHGVPVPRVLCLCEDETVIGTPFYMMQYVPGRIFKDPLLPGLDNEERRRIYESMCQVLVKIHNVDINAAGLQHFGKSGEYLKRNFARWLDQFEASKTDEMPMMDKLTSWLRQHMPADDKTCLIHGDYRLDNLIFDESKPEVVAVLDWELSTLGDPVCDLADNCRAYYLPHDFPLMPSLGGYNIECFNIPSVDQYLQHYVQLTSMKPIDNWNFYMAYVLFRSAAILQGVYKRFTLGQASSATSESTGVLAKSVAHIGWQVASGQLTSSSRDVSAASLAVSVCALSACAQDYHRRVRSFIEEHILPVEQDVLNWQSEPQTKWTTHPRIEQLKVMAKTQGLWNLFLPRDTDPDRLYGAGLTNIEYAFICEEMGKSLIAPEVFNCSAPDTGNMEILVRYGTDEQKRRWLQPLLDGTIRSCFAMTEPAVASSDATNIKASIRREGNEYVINAHKWWISGALNSECRLCILMGKITRPSPSSSQPKHRGPHHQQSMMLVPMDSAGITVLRPLTVFGYDDAPHGHAEMTFENVHVSADNILLGEGRGFEIAQGRLGPGRIHHCMRMIGWAERALDMMITRVQSRVAFGKPLAEQGMIQADIAKSRIDIDSNRLLVLQAAHVMDILGNKVAAGEIAMIKVSVPTMTCNVIDRAIQAHGGLGLCQDTPLPLMYMWSRALRIADGPDEVHLRTIAKRELQNISKL